MLSSHLLRGTALVLLAASSVLAQVTPSISTNPLGTSSFTTPFYSPSQTYTITSTFPVNTPVSETTIGGATGPSPATGAYTFSYPKPLNSATMTAITGLYSSLAKEGLPTAYTSAFQPQVSDLDIVDGAPGSYGSRSAVGVLVTVALGVVVGMALV